MSDFVTVRSAGQQAAAGGLRAEWPIYLLVLCGLGALLHYNVTEVAPRIVNAIETDLKARWLAYPSLLWLAMGAILLAFRTIAWMFYRPVPAVAADQAPRLTVVIPAYNEGAMVLRSIVSVAEADYPEERLEILVIDDGSTDDTWTYIAEAAARYPTRVTAIRQPHNQGKRAALALGFKRAAGDFVVTIDSDSVIEPEALRALVAPFENPKVGAVAGKVLAFNRKGLIPRMLHARYVLAFDLMRAAESSFGNVFCCPGALTGLRTSAIRPLLAEWESQRFLGAACDAGEDRALTNYLLREGYDTVYQGNAVVHTLVPTDYRQLCKMFLRWDRSYVREELRFARIVWKRKGWTRVIALYDRFMTNLRYPIYYGSLGLMAMMISHDPWAAVRIAAVIGMAALCNMLFFLRSERSLHFLWGVLYAYVSIFSLSWIFPYAVVTVRRRGWLTR